MMRVRSRVVTTENPVRGSWRHAWPLRRYPGQARRSSSRAPQQARIAETGDDIGVRALVFALSDFIDQTKKAHRLVIVALDRHGPVQRSRRDDLGTRGGHGPCGLRNRRPSSIAWCWD